MFNEIEEAIIEVLTTNIKSLGKSQVSNAAPKNKLPYVQVSNTSFEAVDSGIGRHIDTDELVTDVFSGDGKTAKFKLSEPPVRPIMSAEIGGRRSGAVTFSVDFLEGSIVFKTPPPVGEDNVTVRYRKPFEVHGLRLNLVYALTVSGKDESERDTVTEEVIKALIREEDSLAERGVSLKLVRGYNGEAAGGVFSKVVEYVVDSDVSVKIEVPRISEVDLRRPEKI